jgi:hypothetical protein
MISWLTWASFGLPQLLTVGGPITAASILGLQWGAGAFYTPLGSSRSLSGLNAMIETRHSLFIPRLEFSTGLWLQRQALTLPIPFLSTDQGERPTATLSFWGAYLVPQLGVTWYRGEKLTLQTEVGLRISLFSTGQISASTEDPNLAPLAASLQSASKRSASHFSQLLVPQITFIRLNWWI